MSYNGPVRIIQKDEEDNVMELCRKLHQENGIFSMNDDKVKSILDKAFYHQGGILAGIGPKGNLQGLLYLWLSSYWYTTDSHWEELFLYVMPEYRKSKNAVELLKFAKWCSDRSTFPLMIGILSNNPTDRRERLYDRHLDGGIVVHEELSFTKGMIEAFNSLEKVEHKDLRSVINNSKQKAEKRKEELEKEEAQSKSKKGRFFLYKKAA